MKTFFKIICLLTFAASISGCNVFCTEGEGSIETETRNLEDFKSIVLDVSADVTVVKGQPAKVEIQTYRNLLQKIETKTSGGKLKLSSDGCISAGEKIKIKAAKVVGFKAGKALKEAVKEDAREGNK